MGCHVGAIHIRSCDWGCCPYDRDTRQSIEENERYGYRDGINNAVRIQRWKPRGQCINPYKPKFVCVSCRRTFKHAIIEGNEYRTDDYGRKLAVRPGYDKIPEVWQEYRKFARRKELRRSLYDIETQESVFYQAGVAAFRKDELEQLRKQSPVFWWRPLTQMRCPGCGKDGREVGSTFRGPGRNDKKGWEKVQSLLEKGEQFSYCVTPDEEKELVMEAARREQRRSMDTAWRIERQCMIDTLKRAMQEGIYTVDEGKKLAAIRQWR